MSGLNSRAVSAGLVLAVLALIVLTPMAGLLNLSGIPGFEPGDLRFWESAYIRRVLFFSLWQALLSTLCSVLPAILVARAFAMQPEFPLRGLLLRLFALPLVVPAVVAVMGVVRFTAAVAGFLLAGRFTGLTVFYWPTCFSICRSRSDYCCHSGRPFRNITGSSVSNSV